MRVAVITIVSGRRPHLRRQHAGIAASTLQPSSYVIVGMDDSRISRWRPPGEPFPLVEQVRSTGSGLPLSAARNAGADRAIQAGADLLVFLDVDCIPSTSLVERYAAAADERPDALLGGAVGYLPRHASQSAFALDETRMATAAHFHDFRPRLVAGDIQSAEHRLFWSLSFAVTAETWRRIGGFDEGYAGYGGEDTDFGLRALHAGVEFLWVGGAEAFHQYHPTSDPPLQHLDDILANGARFAKRWGFWPMEGWLQDFERLGVAQRNPLTGAWARGGMDK
jgi:N-acetylglucosaminyl-diphospho-decaprenol L-rhamnosyltransferase